MLKAPPLLEHNEKIAFIDQEVCPPQTPYRQAPLSLTFQPPVWKWILLFTCQQQNDISLYCAEWTKTASLLSDEGNAWCLCVVTFSILEEIGYYKMDQRSIYKTLALLASTVGFWGGWHIETLRLSGVYP